MEGRKQLDVVSFVLVGIFFACVIFAGLSAGKIPADAAGVAILSWVALAHVAGLIYSICKGETEAAVVIFVFSGFWLTLGIGLNILKSESLHQLLLWVEPALFLVVVMWQCFYRDDSELRAILFGLAGIIAWLFISKFLPVISVATPVLVLCLGVWAITLALYRSDKAHS